jgi:hypothetical protein
MTGCFKLIYNIAGALLNNRVTVVKECSGFLKTECQQTFMSIKLINCREYSAWDIFK